MRVVVAMSGGVDSSVAAALLVDQGHEVIGLSMQLYDASGDESFGSCCSIDDLHDARRVASVLKIPHYLVNLERQFDERVVSNFVTEYAAGRTPLPCAHCNSDLKFSALDDRARAFGADAVATGHYARVSADPETGRYVLSRGLDRAKDQAYFLFGLTQSQLARACFPVGHRSKDENRAYARARKLPVADKPDSQEICFVPDRDYAAVVARRAPDAALPGPVVDEGGHVLARHEGIHRFTIGQRKGLGLSSSVPLYVVAIDAGARQVIVGPRRALERTGVVASRVNWIVDPPREPRRVTAQIRHRHPAAPGVVRGLPDSRAMLRFDAPQTAVTPGQAVVFYDGETVLGGGWIDGADVSEDERVLA